MSDQLAASLAASLTAGSLQSSAHQARLLPQRESREIARAGDRGHLRTIGRSPCAKSVQEYIPATAFSRHPSPSEWVMLMYRRGAHPWLHAPPPQLRAPHQHLPRAPPHGIDAHRYVSIPNPMSDAIACPRG